MTNEWDKYIKRVSYYAVKRLNLPEHYTDDVAQDTAISLYEHGHAVTFPKTWLWVVAKSKAYNYFKRHKETQELTDYPVYPTVNDLDGMLSGLSAKHKEYLTAKYGEGLSNAEIAKRYRISEPTVSRHINQSLSKLRHTINR